MFLFGHPHRLWTPQKDTQPSVACETWCKNHFQYGDMGGVGKLRRIYATFGKYTAAGNGATEREAKRDAAENLLALVRRRDGVRRAVFDDRHHWCDCNDRDVALMKHMRWRQNALRVYREHRNALGLINRLICVVVGVAVGLLVAMALSLAF